jgi:hypothetical protein
MSISSEEKFFRTNVFSLKNMNPSWTPSNIADFMQKCENPPNLTRKSLVRKIKRRLEIGSIDDKPRSGHPTTISTQPFIRNVKKLIKLKKSASIRKTHTILKRKGLQCSQKPVRLAIKKLNLKWYKARKSQKLTENNKLRRIECAKRLIAKFGTDKKSKKWKWNSVVNTDFSGIFTLQAFNNSRNDGIWAEGKEEIPYSLSTRPSEKYKKGIMFWGAISSHGLIPCRNPINVTKWLQQQKPSNNKRKKIYLNGDLYAKFIRTKAAKAIKNVFNKSKLKPIFQDDQDGKQRTQVALEAVASLFDERVDPNDCDAKFADVWCIENVWGALKEKVRGKEFDNDSQLEKEIGKQWRSFTIEQCQDMIEKVPKRLQQVIQKNGEQIYEH